jgi:hypothetical protein
MILRRLWRKVLRTLGYDRRDFFLRKMPKRSVCAEIGVWKGDFSARILKFVKPTRLHLIDPWIAESGEEYRGARYGERVTQEEMDGLYQEVRERFEEAAWQGIVSFHRSTSAEAAPLFPEEYFDWVYVDGNHRYKFVKQDLELFLPKVKPGGYIAGDDYGSVGWWEDGVTRAVDEFVASGPCRLVSVEGHIHQFVLQKPG